MGVTFRQRLEAATSDQLMESDLALNLEVVDSIRQGDVTGKTAVMAIRKRLATKNANIRLKTLELLEMVVKNCGSGVQAQIATKEFMAVMQDLIQTAPLQVKKKACEMLQTWAHAFKKEPSYKVVPDTFHTLQLEGHQFPEFNPQAEAMFVADKAPDWEDGNVCNRCRVNFTFRTRKHHCRACGQIFCQKCSSKTSTVPKFGIEKEVRVCDRCFDELNGSGAVSTSSPAGGEEMSEYELMKEKAEEYANMSDAEIAAAIEKASREVGMVPSYDSGSTGSTTNDKQREAELKEQEEMELALALSLSEAEQASAKKYGVYRASPPASAPMTSSYPSMAANTKTYPSAPTNPYHDPEEDDAMAQYLRGASATRASAPPAQHAQAVQPQQQQPQPQQQRQSAYQPDEALLAAEPSLEPEIDMEFIRRFEQSLDLFERKVAACTEHNYHEPDARTMTMFQRMSQKAPDVVQQMDDMEYEIDNVKLLEEKWLRVERLMFDLRAAKDEADRKREEQRREQELLERMQLEQKMKLIMKQEEEQRAYEDQMRAQIQMNSAAAAAAAAVPAMQPGYPPHMGYAHPPPPASSVPGGMPYSSMPSPQHQLPQHAPPMPQHQHQPVQHFQQGPGMMHAPPVSQPMPMPPPGQGLPQHAPPPHPGQMLQQPPPQTQGPPPQQHYQPPPPPQQQQQPPQMQQPPQFQQQQQPPPPQQPQQPQQPPAPLPTKPSASEGLESLFAPQPAAPAPVQPPQPQAQPPMHAQMHQQPMPGYAPPPQLHNQQHQPQPQPGFHQQPPPQHPQYFPGQPQAQPHAPVIPAAYHHHPAPEKDEPLISFD